MTPQQKTALKYHCRLAGECVNPRFGTSYPLYSLVLTMNSGYE